MKFLYKIDNLQHSYDSGFILKVPELLIKEGAITGFAGPNGSGKSTLFRILAFLEVPQRGVVSYDNFSEYDVAAVREEVTFLMQDPYLLKRSVFENVAYGLRRRKKGNDIKQEVYQALENVSLDPGKYANRRWYQLSGGEAQRVALASRLVLKPRVLILDEPVSSNDSVSAEHIRVVLGNIRERLGTTILLTSHDMIWLGRIADEIVRLNEGMIISSETENIISGPWSRDKNGLWSTKFSSEARIYAANPPYINARALLEPADILVSVKKPGRSSAHNMLRGTISSMYRDRISGTIRISVDTGHVNIDANITADSVSKLNLMPGKKVWLVFKASSLRWS